MALEESPDHKSVPKMKEHAASVGTGLELTHGTRRKVAKSLRGAKHPGWKLIGKADSNLRSGKDTADKVTDNNRSVSVASQRSATEVRPNTTSVHSFFFFTWKEDQALGKVQ